MIIYDLYTSVMNEGFVSICVTMFTLANTQLTLSTRVLGGEA